MKLIKYFAGAALAIIVLVLLTACSTDEINGFDPITVDGFRLHPDRHGGFVIIGYTGPGGALVIPEEINGSPVTTIGAAAFSSRALTSVVIPNSVTRIGDLAFNNNRLTSVIIPYRVTFIGERAFSNNQLTSVNIPDKVSSIGNLAFYRNLDLNEITVGRNNRHYTSIDGVLFNFNKTRLILFPPARDDQYVIPHSVTKIEDMAFAFSRLTSISIGHRVASIGDGTFAQGHLTSVYIPNSVNSIGDGAFARGRLISVYIPNSVTTIGDFAFRHNRLTSVIIPDRVTSIGTEVFASNHLISVVIPNSVTVIGDRAFFDNRLTTIVIGANVELGAGAFCFSFESTYLFARRAAGTYTRPNLASRIWTRR